MGGDIPQMFGLQHGYGIIVIAPFSFEKFGHLQGFTLHLILVFKLFTPYFMRLVLLFFVVNLYN
jgi:hypothetical protein